MYRFLIPKSLISLTKGSFAGEGTKCIFSYNRVTCTQKKSALPNETHLYLYFHNMTLYAGEALSPHRWQLLDIYTPRWLNWDMEERFGVF